MRVGICGYPGSGKSSVFAALAPGAQSARGGVTFGNIKVPDARVDRLKEIFDPKKTTYAEITFVDVPGGGGAKGAFPPDTVQHMRNVDVLVHVVRVFENPMVSDAVDPERDVEAFRDELLLLDMTVLEKRADRMTREHNLGAELDVTRKCIAHLDEGLPLRRLELSNDEQGHLLGLQLLSARPLINLYNLSEEAWGDAQSAGLKEVRGPDQNEMSLAISASIEMEIATLDDPEEQKEFLADLGLDEPARDPFVRAAYSLLDLISFLTCGPDECRAWPLRRGTSARGAGGKIHSDIERGFIRVEIFRLEELEEAGSEAALKKAGKLRVEGRDYIVQDGDIANFRFNV